MQSFMEVAGVVPDEENKLDGISMIPAFKQEGLKREKLFWHYPHYHKGSGMVPASAMRWKNYKLIEWHEQMLKNEKGQITTNIFKGQQKSEELLSILGYEK
jgi:hypothetical protein